jgi:predicted nucleotidyltransferase
MTKSVNSILLELKKGLEGIYGAQMKGVYLYSSYAREEQDDESDLDALIVLDHMGRYGAEIDRTGQLISTLSLQHGTSISRVFVSEEDWLGLDTAFLSNVRAEAISL